MLWCAGLLLLPNGQGENVFDSSGSETPPPGGGRGSICAERLNACGLQQPFHNNIESLWNIKPPAKLLTYSMKSKTRARVEALSILFPGSDDGPISEKVPGSRWLFGWDRLYVDL